MPAATPHFWPAHQEWWEVEEEDPAIAATTEPWDPEAATTTESVTPFFWGVLGGTAAGSETGPDPDEEVDWRFWGVAGALGVCALSLLIIFVWKIR